MKKLVLVSHRVAARAQIPGIKIPGINFHQRVWVWVLKHTLCVRSVCGGVNNAPRAAANTLPDPSTPHSGLSWAAVTWRSHLLRTTLVFALLDCLASC